MKWPEFLMALDEQNEAIEEAEEMGGDPPKPDQVVMAGMIAVAFWQGNPTMSRDKVRRALERTNVEDIEIIDGDEEEVDVGPPAQGGDLSATPSTTSSGLDVPPEESAGLSPQDFISDETSPNGSGHPGLPITSQELSPT